MTRLIPAVALCLAFIGPAMAEDAKPAAPPAKVRFETVPQNAVLSSNLKSLTVVDGQNKSVAEIKDLVVERGRLVGYIVGVGGLLGLGERYVDIDPASVALVYDSGAKKWTASVNASADQLKAAPEFKYDGKFNQ